MYTIIVNTTFVTTNIINNHTFYVIAVQGIVCTWYWHIVVPGI